jgi:DNA-binding FrmR family transcriptional regulator
MKDLKNRLNRVKGQIEAIEKNISASDGQDNDECQDILHQIKAARNALKKVSDQYIANYIEACILEIEGENQKKNQKDKIKDILQTALDM